MNLEISRADDVPILFAAGDSTVGNPCCGLGGNWPTQMCQFFKPGIAVCNIAEGGETSKSFITRRTRQLIPLAYVFKEIK